MSCSQSTIKGSQGRKKLKQTRNMEAGLRQEAWRSITSWIAPHTLLSLLFDTTKDNQPRGGTDTVCWALPHQYSRELPTSLPTGNLMEVLSQLRFFFPDDSKLCPLTGKKKTTLNQSTRTIDCLPTWHTNVPLLNNNLSFFVYTQDLILISIPQYKTNSNFFKFPQPLKLQTLRADSTVKTTGFFS